MKLLLVTGVLALTGCLGDSAPNATPDIVQTDTASSNLADADLVDTDLPDTSPSDTTATDTAVPDTDLPDTDQADTDQADTDLPDTDVADTPSDTTGTDSVDPGEVRPRGEIGGQPTDETTPGQTLQLVIERAADAPTITGYRWSVDQPADSVETFVPNAEVESPTFTAWVVGTYTFHLDVIDTDNQVRRAGSYRLLVAPGAGLHVELTWHTPGDPDETDTGTTASFSVGSDVDLHLLHPTSNGVYWDPIYDCFWENPNPEWGAAGQADNPALDRDDTDGVGPEVTSLEGVEAIGLYRVAAHYWSDWGYGRSQATIRIFLGGVLSDEWTMEIGAGDMWESHTIDASTGTVARVTNPDGSPRTFQSYPPF